MEDSTVSQHAIREAALSQLREDDPAHWGPHHCGIVIGDNLACMPRQRLGADGVPQKAFGSGRKPPQPPQAAPPTKRTRTPPGVSERAARPQHLQPQPSAGPCETCA